MAERPLVLLVDDEERMLSALRRTLRREPYDLDFAENGAKALARMAQTPVPDLVISDYKMPGMTGLELLRRVRQMSGSTARILLSGWTFEISDQDLKKAGLSSNLAKPWDDAELKGAILAALDLD